MKDELCKEISDMMLVWERQALARDRGSVPSYHAGFGIIKRRWFQVMAELDAGDKTQFSQVHEVRCIPLVLREIVITGSMTPRAGSVGNMFMTLRIRVWDKLGEHGSFKCVNTAVGIMEEELHELADAAVEDADLR